MNKILQNIEAIRKYKAIKQEVIASGLGITQAGYSLIIKNKRKLTLKDLLQIAILLDVNVVDIFTYPDVYTHKDNCANCHEKDIIIRNLNNYIKLLEASMGVGYIAVDPVQYRDNTDKINKKL